MSHSQFHCTGRAYLDMHGLIFETSICYWQDQPGRSASEAARGRGEPEAGGRAGRREREGGRRTREGSERAGGSRRAREPPTPHPPPSRAGPRTRETHDAARPSVLRFPLPSRASGEPKRPRARRGGGSERPEDTAGDGPAGSEDPRAGPRGDGNRGRDGTDPGKPPVRTRGTDRREARPPTPTRGGDRAPAREDAADASAGSPGSDGETRGRGAPAAGRDATRAGGGNGRPPVGAAETGRRGTRRPRAVARRGRPTEGRGPGAKTEGRRRKPRRRADGARGRRSRSRRERRGGPGEGPPAARGRGRGRRRPAGARPEPGTRAGTSPPGAALGAAAVPRGPGRAYRPGATDHGPRPTDDRRAERRPSFLPRGARASPAPAPRRRESRGRRDLQALSRPPNGPPRTTAAARRACPAAPREGPGSTVGSADRGGTDGVRGGGTARRTRAGRRQGRRERPREAPPPGREEPQRHDRADG